MSSSSADDGVEDLSQALAGASLDPEVVAQSDMVIVRPTETAGMGVFALRDIPRGTRIAAEAPLIMIPPGPDEESATRFCEALLRTAEGDLARIDEHHCDPLTLQTIRTTAIGAEILRWCEENLSALTGTTTTTTTASNSSASSGSSRAPVSTAQSLEATAEQTCRRYAIFLTNNLDTGGPAGRGHFGLFSRMNHSCTPSVFDHYNGALGRLTSHAARGVRAGEQLFSHYVDVLLPRGPRRRRLRAWGFACRCAACADDALEALRARAVELDDAVEEYADYREDPAAWAGGEKPVLATAGDALEASRELVRLLEKQDLHGLELFNAYRFCSKFSHELGDAKNALHYARLALDVERCCVGRDATLADDLWEDTNKWIESLRGTTKS